jgi:hypothetical protein
VDDWKSQIVISNKEKMGIRKLPLAFTEQGVAKMRLQVGKAYVWRRREFYSIKN